MFGSLGWQELMIALPIVIIVAGLVVWGIKQL